MGTLLLLWLTVQYSIVAIFTFLLIFDFPFQIDILKNQTINLQEDVKSLITYVVEDYMSSFESVDYVQTFKGLKMRYDQERDRQNRKNMDR